MKSVIKALHEALVWLRREGSGAHHRIYNYDRGEVAVAARYSRTVAEKLNEDVTSALRSASARQEQLDHERQMAEEQPRDAVDQLKRHVAEVRQRVTSESWRLQQRIIDLERRLAQSGQRAAADRPQLQPHDRVCMGDRWHDVPDHKTALMLDALAPIDAIQRRDVLIWTKEARTTTTPGIKEAMTLDLWQSLMDCREKARAAVRQIVSLGYSPGSAQDALDLLQNVLQNFKVPSPPSNPEPCAPSAIVEGDEVLIAGVWIGVPSQSHAMAWSGKPFIDAVQRKGVVMFRRPEKR